MSDRKQIPFERGKNVLPAFLTPIGTFRVPDHESLNPALEAEILRRMQEDEGQTRSNVGGWHSMDNLFSWEPAAFKDLGEWIHSAAMNMVAVGSRTRRFRVKCQLSGWANVNGPGQYNGNHNHPGCSWSGVYYVRVEDTTDDPLPRAGHLQFYDPRGSIEMIRHPGKSMFGHTITIRPQSGMLLVFPAWLYHSVNPFLSDVTRISIAFNARLNDFETIEETDDDPVEVKVDIDDEGQLEPKNSGDGKKPARSSQSAQQKTAKNSTK